MEGTHVRRAPVCEMSEIALALNCALHSCCGFVPPSRSLAPAGGGGGVGVGGVLQTSQKRERVCCPQKLVRHQSCEKKSMLEEGWGGAPVKPRGKNFICGHKSPPPPAGQTLDRPELKFLPQGGWVTRHGIPSRLL